MCAVQGIEIKFISNRKEYKYVVGIATDRKLHYLNAEKDVFGVDTEKVRSLLSEYMPEDFVWYG